MSNGAQSAKGNAARATTASGSIRAVTGMAATQDDAGLSDLVFHDPMDAGGGLEASQISQTQIIERQAETIARLERHAARDQEYRTVTKVKLKEAAQRLKEYRLRVESLMSEVETAKAAIAKLEGEKKKAQASNRKKPVAVEPKKPETKTVGVQTPWKKALRTVSVQTIATSTTDATIQVSMEPLAPAHSSAANGHATRSPENASSIHAVPIQFSESASAASVLSTTVNGSFDAIDAALDFSDDDEDDEDHGESAFDPAKARALPLSAMSEAPLVMPVELPDAISREIDELELLSSSDDDSSDDESDGGTITVDRPALMRGSKQTTSANTAVAENADAGAEFDLIATAIEAEMASDSEDEEQRDEEGAAEPLTHKDFLSTPQQKSEDTAAQAGPLEGALPQVTLVSSGSGILTESDDIGGVIDAELASSSEDEGETAALAVDPMRAIEPPKSPADHIVASAPSRGPIVAAETIGTVAVDESSEVRERAEQILHEKSRTLSLSSSSSSDGEISEHAGIQEECPHHVEPSQSPSTQDFIGPTVGTDAVTGGTDHDSIDHKPPKRRSTSTDAAGKDKPQLKKRKIEPPEETASTPAPPKAAAQDARAAHEKAEVPRKAPAVGVLGPRDLVAFKVAIALRDGEAPDSAYVTRTLGVLVKQAATLLRANSSASDHIVAVADDPHVTKLCKTLVEELVHRQVSHELLLEGMMRIFRTPRTRHVIDKSIVMLTVVFQIVLFLRLGYGAISGRVDDDKLTTDMVPQVHQCLLTLRDLVVNSRLKDGLVLSRTEDTKNAAMAAASSVRPAQNVSHDKAFLAHVAAFHASICRALDRFDLPLVLLVDLLSCHPNIKGLYCAHAIAQVDPRVLRKRWGVRGQEQRSALRATLVHVLQVITIRSRDNQEVVYRESAPSLLSSIANWIDDPLLASINPAGDPHELQNAIRSFATMMWSTHIDRSLRNRDAQVFDLSKALELLAAAHGDAAMVYHLPVSKFGAANFSRPVQRGIDVAHGDSHSRRTSQVARLVGALARGTLQASNYRDGNDRAVRHELCYVGEAVRWMLTSCPRDENCDMELLNAVVSELTDLLIGLSADASVCKQRDEWLRELLQILSPQHLQCLPGQPLRQLRLLVMAARPLASSCRATVPAVAASRRVARSKGQQFQFAKIVLPVAGLVVAGALAVGYGVRKMSDAADVEVAVEDGDGLPPVENEREGVVTANGDCEVVEVVDDRMEDEDDEAASQKTTPPVLPENQANAPGAAGARLTRKDSINSTNYRAMAARAIATARLNRLGAGKKSAFQAKMSDIGALGIGLQLYFMLTKYLAVAFFIMGIIALPSIILNKAGHGITSKMVDPLQLGYASLGNQGVNEDIASDPRLCLPHGDIDCNWTTVNTPFTTSPAKVSWILTISDCTYSIVFLFFFLFYRFRAKSAIDEHMNENLTPAKYAVFVKGLPLDATETEILQHFNTRYDLTKEEEYNPLWFGMCWGTRRKAKHTLSRNAVNRNTVKNLDHLAGTQSINKELYLNTWIAEVSVGHPTGGLLRTFLSMETLTQSISETRELIKILEHEKMVSLSTFKKGDERLIHTSRKRLDKLEDELEKQRGKIKSIKQANNAIKKADQAEKKRVAAEQELKKSKKKKAQAKVAAAANAAKIAAMATNAAFNWDACECAFVVFNNLESRRRCLQDYRFSARWLPHKFQPKTIRFRNGEHRLVVTPAPEPSNILWENLEVTDRGRFYRRSLTNFVTFLLLLASAAIISGAQSAQQQFKSKMPPAGLCDRSLPPVFYGATTYASSTIRWNLQWYPEKQCPLGSDGKKQYYIAYDNGVVNALNINNPAPIKDPSNPPERCTSPCISESVEQPCSTLPCFDQDLLDGGATCETYQASHTLYCLCTKALTDHIDEYGLVDGAKRLWTDVTPCRGFIKDYLKKNGLIIAAAAVVVVVNMILNIILRCFADFERHSSESAKATAIALKMFLAQFLNTAVIVLVVNASLGLRRVPVVKELLKGKYRDFERDWYPTVGMGITTTMLFNAFTPQLLLSLQMFVMAPLRRCWSRRAIRTQKQMDKLYAGPQFDISLRYPMVLNSLFVTMVFCGGSPILLFIAAVTALGTYWLDKLSIIHLYSVNTAYDEELGELAILLLPWTLVGHLAFSTWMYGNKELMKSTTIDLPWLLKRIGLKSLVDQYGDENSDALYNAFLEKASQVDVLGKYGFLVKVVRSNVMLVFLFFIGSVLCVLVSMIWVQFVWPLLTKMWNLVVTTCCAARRRPLPPSADASATTPRRKSSGAPGSTPPAPPVILPEFTDFFRKSVKPSFRPDKLLGFQRNEEGQLGRVWMEPHSFHGVKHLEGEQMRTWEAMQAPVKSYAIERNDKYRLAFNEIVAAARFLREAAEKSRKTIPIPVDANDEEAIMADITATEPVSLGQRTKGSKAPAVKVKQQNERHHSNRSSSSSSEASTIKK